MNKIIEYQVDLGGLPPLTNDFWKKVVKNPFYKPVKLAKTVRVDADVLAWLKSAGKGYHTRINAILSDAMMPGVYKTS